MTLRRSIVGGALLVTAAVGCSDASGPRQPEVEVRVEPAVVGVRSQVREGGETSITFEVILAVRNTGKETLVVDACSGVVERHEPGGEWRAMLGTVCDGSSSASPQHVVAPGARVVYGRFYNHVLSGGEHTLWGAPDFGGEYRYRVRVGSVGIGSTSAEVATNTFTLTPE